MQRLTENTWNFANDQIWTADLWRWKQPLCQLSHNHCLFFVWKSMSWTISTFSYIDKLTNQLKLPSSWPRAGTSPGWKRPKQVRPRRRRCRARPGPVRGCSSRGRWERNWRDLKSKLHIISAIGLSIKYVRIRPIP